MSVRPTLSSLYSLALTGALAACAGCTQGQIGGEIGADGGSGEAAAGCVEKDSTTLADGESSALGFTVADLVALTSGTHEAPLVWKTEGAHAENLAVSPAAGDSVLTVTVSAVDGTGRFVDLEEDEGDGEEMMAIGRAACADEVRFDADVRVSSANGAFDDTFRATFRASSPRLVQTGIALKPGDLEGSFDVVIERLENASAVQNELQLSFLPGSMSGSVGGIIQTSDGAVSSGGGVTYGRFPGEDCDLGHWVDPSSEFGAGLVSAVGESGTFDLAWPGGEVTELTVEHVVERICYQERGMAGEERATLSLASHAWSEDERIDGEWRLEGQVELAASGEPSTVRVLRQSYLADTFPVASFTEDAGISGVNFGAAERGTFQFEYEVDRADGSASGALDILRVTVPVCDDEVEETEEGGAAPGCAGSDATSIERATLTDAP